VPLWPLCGNSNSSKAKQSYLPQSGLVHRKVGLSGAMSTYPGKMQGYPRRINLIQAKTKSSRPKQGYLPEINLIHGKTNSSIAKSSDFAVKWTRLPQSGLVRRKVGLSAAK
jgi:hypothetical protein